MGTGQFNFTIRKLCLMYTRSEVENIYILLYLY